MAQLTAERERCRARATQYRQEAQSLARRLAAKPSASAVDAARGRHMSQESEFEVAGGAKQVWFRVSEPDTLGEKTLTIRVTTDSDGGPEIREVTIPQRVWPFVQRFCDAAQRADGKDVVASRTPSPAARPRATPHQSSEGNSGQRAESAAAVAASPAPLHQTSARGFTQRQHVDPCNSRHATTQRAQRRLPQGHMPQVAVEGTPENNAGAAKGRHRGPSRQPTHGPQTQTPSKQQQQQQQQQQQPKKKPNGRPEAPQQQASARKGRRRGGNSASGSVDDSQSTKCVISVRGGNVKISTSDSP